MLKVWFNGEIVAEGIESVWEAYEVGYNYCTPDLMAFILTEEGRELDFVCITDKRIGYHGKDKVEDYVIQEVYYKYEDIFDED